MNPWTALVEMLAETASRIGAAVGGQPAVGIVSLAFSVRAALIPLMLPIGIRSRARRRVVQRIRPEIKALDRAFRDDPSELSRRLKALHEANGIRVVDWFGLCGAFIQLPILVALFQAVLLVWEPDAMTFSGFGLGTFAAVVSLLSAKWNGQVEDQPFMLWLSLLLPVAISLWLGAGVALYLLGFYGASAIQGLLTPKDQPAAEADPA